MLLDKMSGLCQHSRLSLRHFALKVGKAHIEMRVWDHKDGHLRWAVKLISIA